MRESGNVYWITGLSGAGKTTIGNMLYEYIHKNKRNVMLLDGDNFRKIYDNDDFTKEGRDKVAKMNQRMIKTISEQGIDVVCCLIAMFDKYREWNRENYENYYEIYLKVDLKELIHRDVKGLYHKALTGEIKNVYGIDLDFEEPKNPDLIINNQGNVSPEDALNQIVKYLEL